MTQVSNCIVCAEEFDTDELYSIALSRVNVTRFKICQKCLDKSDPTDDYKEAREIVNTYLKLSEAKHLFKEAKEILNSRDK